MKKVVFTFGRMNPITNGHGKLVKKVQSVAKANRADPHVYLSHTQDSKKNPLNYKTKLNYAKSAFGNVVKQSNDKTVINILKSLQKNYSDVVMVVGSDRVNEFKKLLDKYNGKDFKFKTVDVVSSGDRDPDAEGVTGMSASKLRDLAVKDKYTEFKMGLPNLREPKMQQIFKDVRKGMNLEELEQEMDLITEEELEIFVSTLSDDELDAEYIEERAPLTIMQRIKRGRMMRRLAPRFKRLRKIKKFRVAPLQRLKFRAKQAAKKLFRKRLAGKKGENYAKLPASQKIAIDKMISKRSGMIDKFAKRMLPQVRKKEMARIQQARKSASGKKESYNPETAYTEYLSERTVDEKLYWPDKLRNAFYRLVHPKGYEQAVKMYIDRRKKGEIGVVGKVANLFRGINPRDLEDYITMMVKKGVIPKTLAASYTEQTDPNTAYLEYIDEARGRRGKVAKKGEEEKDTENIIMQLRKSVSLRGLKKVKFDDGKVVQVKAKDAEKALDMFNKIRMNNQKYKFMRSLSKSPQSLKKAINANFDINPGGPAAMDKYRMSYISANKSSFSPRNNYQIEDAVARVRAAISKEKDSDKVKHDKMMDAARLKKTRTKNIQTKAESTNYFRSCKINESLQKKSKRSGLSFDIISELYTRGVKSWNEDSKMTKDQTGFARVNSFINKGKTYDTDDKDLQPYQVGTTPKEYTKDTPGQDYGHLLNQIKNINNSNSKES